MDHPSTAASHVFQSQFRGELEEFRAAFRVDLQSLLASMQSQHNELLMRYDTALQQLRGEFSSSHNDSSHAIRMESPSCAALPIVPILLGCDVEDQSKPLVAGFDTCDSIDVGPEAVELVSPVSPGRRPATGLVLQTAEAEKDVKTERAVIKVAAGAFGDLQGDKAHFQRDVYDVRDFYWTTGCAQAVARSEVFANIALLVIACNAVYIGIVADRESAEGPQQAQWPFILCDQVFCLLFVLEWAVRFLAFRRKRYCLRDNWFKFDSALVMLMVAETWLTPILFFLINERGSGLPTGPLRLMRLLRLTRLARLMRSLPELVTMLKGMKFAARAVSSSVLLVTFFIYVFSIILHMLVRHEETVAHEFKTLPRCMWTLLMDGTFMDSTGKTLGLLIDLEAWNAYLSILVFMIFIGLSAVTVMNMLIGVVCEVVTNVAQGERDEAAIKLMRDSILVLLNKFDADRSGGICKGELELVLNDEHSVEVLQALEVDVEHLREVQNMLFDELDEVSIEGILDLMLVCRGGLPATVKHIVDSHAFTRWSLSSTLSQQERRIDVQLHQLSTQVAQLVDRLVLQAVPHIWQTEAQEGCFSDKARWS